MNLKKCLFRLSKSSLNSSNFQRERRKNWDQKLQASYHSELLFKSLRKIHTRKSNVSSDYFSTHRKEYSTNHVYLRLIENWKAVLDSNLFTGAVLKDFSKAFDCILHDLLIAKLHAYGFSFERLTFVNSYLRNRNQCVKTNNICSDFLKNVVRYNIGLYTKSDII